MRKRDLARRLRDECEVVKRLEHQHYLDGMAVELVERVLTAHWDMAACRCPFCTEARIAGFRPREHHLDGVHDWWEAIAHANEPPTERARRLAASGLLGKERTE